jgi:hypothetical protein
VQNPPYAHLYRFNPLGFSIHYLLADRSFDPRYLSICLVDTAALQDCRVFYRDRVQVAESHHLIPFQNHACDLMAQNSSYDKKRQYDKA